MTTATAYPVFSVGHMIHAAAAASVEMQAYRPRPSDGVTKCRRQLAYHAMGAEPKMASGRMPIIWDDGHMAEEQTLALIASLPGARVVETQGRVEHGNMTGSFDALVDFGYGHELFEHKAINHFTWERYERGEEWPEDYFYQTCWYAKSLMESGAPIRASRLFIKNKSTGAYLEWQFELGAAFFRPVGLFSTRIPDEKLEPTGQAISWQGCIDRYAERDAYVADHVSRGELPPRDYVIGPDWQCSYCPFEGRCTEGLEAETMSAGMVEAEGSALEIIQVMDAYRASRLGAGKGEDATKEDLIRFMREIKAEVLRIGDRVFMRQIAYTVNQDGEQVPADTLKSMSYKTYLKKEGKA